MSAFGAGLRSPLVLAACLSTLSLEAGVLLPDHILYGTIAIQNRPVTRAQTEVVIEARRAENGPVLASYRMGAEPRLGEVLYQLRVPLEEAPRSSEAFAQPDETLLITVRDSRGVQFRTTHRLTEPGVALRLDFGASLDTGNDGVPDAWELARLGAVNPDLGRDSDGDGVVDRDEYTAGTLPLDASDVFRLAVLSDEPGKIQVQFRALAPVGPGYDGRHRYYALESRTNLMTGAWQPVENHRRIQGANQWVEFEQRVVGDEPPPFFRARVWLEGP
jgi:hypothetical protein